MVELSKYATKAILDGLKKDPGCKYLKATGIGEKAAEISLVYQKTTIWKSIFKISDLEEKIEGLKAVAANYEQLYSEAVK